MTSFFFSYASRDHELATIEDIRGGTRINLLDSFFTGLRNAVAGKLPPAVEVSYRDTPDLRLGDIWPNDLTAALQATRSLVIVLSPSYLASENCGRELKFMVDRFRQGGADKHCVIPIFWESNVTCNPYWPREARELIDSIQTTSNTQLPREYVSLGFKQWMPLARVGDLQQAYHAIADAIVTNFNAASLALHQNAVPFRNLPTMLGAAAREEQTGPTAAQVVYVVPRLAELQAAGVASTEHYAARRQQWRPFNDSPDTTIAQAAEAGVKSGGMSFQDRGWPRGLMDRLSEARDSNSIVLFLLDRHALRLQSYANHMKRYDERTDLPNVGLVTAGGGAVPESEVAGVFEDKFHQRLPNHIWSVVDNRGAFESAVGTTVSSLKRDLMREGMRPDEHPPAVTPHLSGPSGATS